MTNLTTVCLLFTATYCIVIFGLMLLSLLETILITHLIDKDHVSQRMLWLKDDGWEKQEKTDTDNCKTGESS